MKIIVNEANERLDKYLASNTDYSRVLISKMLDADFITVNGKKEKASYKVKENDCIDKENKTPFSVSEDLHDNAYDETYPR